MTDQSTHHRGPRHRAREAALQILYRYDLTHTTDADPKDLTSHFDHFQVVEAQREFAAHLVAGTLKERQAIDLKIEAQSANWKVSRMAIIDRNLLRMALYELMNFKDIPRSVTIDEAVELGKQFGTAETPAFVNGILDAMANTLEAAKTAAT